MSKMDDLRAMREARYKQAVERAAAARSQTAPKAAKPRVPVAPEPSPEVKAEVEPAAGEPDVELCGHRNMSGRTCTREKGHAAKSHRYS